MALLDTIAARAGRAAELLAEAAALRTAVPRLSRLAWLPVDVEGDRPSCYERLVMALLQQQGCVWRELQPCSHCLGGRLLARCAAGDVGRHQG